MRLARAIPQGSSFHAYSGISIFNDIVVANEWTYVTKDLKQKPSNTKKTKNTAQATQTMDMIETSGERDG